MGVLNGVFNLGNAQVIAGGTYKFPLNVVPNDATVRSIAITVSGTIIASSSYSGFKNSGGQGSVMLTNDDIDIMVASIFKSIDLRVANSFQTMSALSTQNMRSGFVIMRRLDFSVSASLVNGATIAASPGTAFTLTITIPLDLRELAADLAVMQVGAERLQGPAQINLNYNTTTTGNFTGTFANGSTTFTIASSSLLVVAGVNNADMGWGGGLTGAVWELVAYSGAKTTDKTQPGVHLGFFDLGPGLASGSYTPSTYNAWNTAPIAQNSSSTDLILNYRETSTLYGPDVTARMIPVLNYGPRATMAQINQSASPIAYQITVSGTNSLTLMELIAHPPTPDDYIFVGKRVNGGGNVAVRRIVAPSQNGRYPGPAAAALLPVVIANPATAPASWTRMAPAAVAGWVAGAVAAQQAAAGVAAQQGRVGGAAVRGH